MNRSNQLTRRQFTRRLGASAVGIVTAPAMVRALGAAERLTLGVIGCGSRGKSLMRRAIEDGHGQIAVVCDVLPKHRDEAAKAAGRPADAVVDYRTVLDRKDVDAVFIATPEHQHAAQLIEAVNAGKDVYCEKPLAHTIEEGQAMIKAVRSTGRVAQVGMQQRSGPHFLEARELINSGRLGDIHLVTSYWYQDFTGHQGRKWPETTGLDWKRFLGSAPWRLLEKEPWRYWDWRYFWDYSGGSLCDNGVHVCDWVNMMMGDRDAPVSASCTGGSYKITRWDTPDIFSAAFEFENGWVSNLNFNYTKHYGLGHFHGTRFLGTNGMLDLSRRGWNFYEKGASEAAEVGEARGLSGPHVRNFFDCVQSRQEPNAPVEIGHHAVRVAHLGNISYRDQRRVLFDPATERVRGS